MLVATYNCNTNKLRMHQRILPKGRGKWVIKIWAKTEQSSDEHEVRPDGLLYLYELYPIISDQVDYLFETVPNIIDMGWEIHKWR